tara:strand:+ start:259 stop:1059 length:801 start_codon:yes stop_codon:yes gene_type:complete
MFINKVSPSKLKTYLECKAKYKFKYVEYLRDIYNPNSNTNALQFGSYVHKILELGVNATTLLELQDLAKSLRKNYKFSSAKEKDMDKILKNFLSLNERLEETVSTEFPFEIDMPDDVKANGIIDRVVKGKTGKYLVIDYKTSRRPATKESLFKDPQMLMYAYAIAKMYNAPLEDVTVAHYYPHLDKIISICYGTTQVSLFLRELKERVWEIRKKKKEDLNPSLNQFCDWCQYKTLCPEFGGTPKMLEEAKAAEKIKKAERKKSKNP